MSSSTASLSQFGRAEWAIRRRGWDAAPACEWTDSSGDGGVTARRLEHCLGRAEMECSAFVVLEIYGLIFLSMRDEESLFAGLGPIAAIK